MEKVIVVNLNGNAFQLNEPAFDLLRTYLDRAKQALASNPDKDEILADIEQAIADKCAPFLGPHKTVVLEAEIRQIVAEMGPVGDSSPEDPASATGDGMAHNASRPAADAPKRLYQVAEGAMISGVCNGIAAYFNVDVTIVRVVFVLLALLTSGLWVLIYLLLMFIIPFANTFEERAAAQGMPFNAQQLIEQAKRNYAAFADGKRWKWQRKHRRQWRSERRRFQQTMRDAEWFGYDSRPQVGYAARILAGFLAPIFVILGAACFVATGVAIISLLATGAILQRPLPAGVPLWAAILIVILVYHFVAWPLHAARRVSYRAMGYGTARGAIAEALIGLGFGLLFLWLAYTNVQAVQDFFTDFPRVWPQMWEHLRHSLGVLTLKLESLITQDYLRFALRAM